MSSQRQYVLTMTVLNYNWPSQLWKEETGKHTQIHGDTVLVSQVRRRATNPWGLSAVLSLMRHSLSRQSLHSPLY